MTIFKRVEAKEVKDSATEPVNVTIKSHIDILNELNDKITEKLKKFDVFDIEVPIIRLKMFLKIVETRHLDWRDIDIEYDDKKVIVVGKKGVNFGQHEKER